MISRTWNKGDLKVSGDRKYKFKFSGVATEAIALFSEQNSLLSFLPQQRTIMFAKICVMALPILPIVCCICWILGNRIQVRSKLTGHDSELSPASHFATSEFLISGHIFGLIALPSRVLPSGFTLFTGYALHSKINLHFAAECVL